MNLKTALRSVVAFGVLLSAGRIVSQTPAPGKTWALVIGISHYSATDVQPLQFAATDAQSIADFLMSERGGGIPEDRIKIMLEGEATKTAVETDLGNFGETVDDGDTVHVFVAGHGFVGGRNKNIGFFIPSDGTPTNLYGTAVSFSYLKDLVEKNLEHTKVRVLMTDICHAGRLSIGQQGTSPNEVNGILGGFVGRGKFLNLLASKATESSYEDEKLGHGVFTYSLLNALNDKAYAKDGKTIDVQSVVQHVQLEVPDLTQKLQNPVANVASEPAFTMAYVDKPGPPPRMVVQTKLLVRNANRAQYESVQWFDPRFRVTNRRRFDKDKDTEQLEALPTGQVEFKFFVQGDPEKPRKTIPHTLQPGENILDVQSAAEHRFRPAGPVQLAAASAALPAGALPLRQAAPAAPATASLLARLPAGTAVQVENVPYGSTTTDNEFFQVQGIEPGFRNVTLITADREYRFRLRLLAGTQIFDLASGEMRYILSPAPDPAQVAIPQEVPANLADAYRRFAVALWEERLITPAGNSAWDAFVQLRGAVPATLRAQIERQMVVAMGNRAQRTILRYLRGEDLRWTAQVFEEAAALTGRMQQIIPAPVDNEARQSFFLGRALIEQARYDEALQQLQRTITLFPDASYAHNARGLAFWRQGQIDQAVAPLQLAIALSPQWTYPRNILAAILMEQRRYDEAEQALQATLLAKPDDSTSHHGLAQIYLRRGRVADSEERVRQAVAFHPGNAYAYETYGLLEDLRGNLDRAEQMFRQAIRLEPDEPSFQVNLAKLLRKRGRLPEAQQLFARVSNSNPADLRVVTAYAEFFPDQNQQRKFFEGAIKLKPKDPNLRVYYGGFFRSQGKDADAEKQYKESLKFADNVFAHFELASLNLSRRKIADAEKELALANKADSRFAKTPILLGSIRLAQKRYAEALDAFTNALELEIDPDEQQKLRDAIAEARRASGTNAIQSAKQEIDRNRMKSAWSIYSSALKDAPNDGALLDALLRFEFEHSANADASILPPSPAADALKTQFWTRQRQAETLWKNGQAAEAIRAFQEALDNLSAADRKSVTAVAFNLRTDAYGIYEMLYRWGNRLIERRDYAGAERLMQSAIRQKIFDYVPGTTAPTIDSLMTAADAAAPDFDNVRHHADRRAHEILAVAAAGRGDRARADALLEALTPAERDAIRPVVERALRQ